MRFLKRAALLCLLLLAVACTKSGGITLGYQAVGVPARCAADMVVFKFEDKRADKTLGRYNDGTAITAVSDVADWVGWALFDELEKVGCRPKYRTSTVTPGEAPMVTGEVLSLSLNQTGATTFEGKIAVRIMVVKAGQTLHIQKYSSQVEDVVLAGYGSEADIMQEALRGVMTEAVPAIIAETGK
ncbi:hypothetical protein [Pseudodesulfovibrio portus]|uniref:Lipoprotein n=1 Tax=Pseudodesulfovibrio portus TaxID=231439 RepID=A0ABM8ARQ2_9BACT|nr:hypothetical protein [Pseudodesulfovibrio portus]BDQ33987.1 hypothetical protein JCM14722_15290 [Pseudodesulfovibrio portus]